MVDRVGQQLGNYRLIRLLGEGGFAEVYLGEHIHLNTRAAIKVLQTQLAKDDLEKFRDEARTIAHLVHPHIVRVLEFDIEDKIPFLVMDYAPNGTLRQRHPKGMPIPLSTIVYYVKQLADALQYAHDKKLIHRDIKPENMLLGQHNEVLLSDFGIALVAQSSRYENMQGVAGTVAYMAPEQLQGKPRLASDQYSLGIVVYEWLSGDRPFHGGFVEIASQHMLVPPPPLCEKVPAISSPVEAVVLRALSKDPQQRFASVQAFANALEQASKLTQLHPLGPSVQLPQSTVGGIQPNSWLPPNLTVIPPNQLPQSTIETIPSSRQQWSTQTGQMGEFARSPQSKKGLRFGLIIGTLFLLTTLIGSGIFFFALNRANFGTGNNPGITPFTSSTAKTVLLPNDLITPGVLTVGSDTTYPPQEFIDSATNKATGFDIDLITAIAQRMGLQAKIVTTKFDTIIDDLVAKRFDVVMSAVSVTPDRQKKADFVPYFNAGESLLVQKGNPKNIKSPADLCGLAVGVQNGTIEQSDLQTADNGCKSKGKPGIQLTILQDQTAVVQLLANNRVVATYQDSPVTDYYNKLNPGQFEVGGPVVAAVPDGIVVRKGDTSMFNAVQTAFNQLKADGTYHQLILKWGLTNEEVAFNHPENEGLSVTLVSQS